MTAKLPNALDLINVDGENQRISATSAIPGLQERILNWLLAVRVSDWGTLKTGHLSHKNAIYEAASTLP